MKIKIICLESENSINFDNDLSKLEVINKEKFNNIKYFKYEKNIIEICYLAIDEKLYNYNLNNNADIIFVLVKSLNEYNVKIIKKLKMKFNISVISGEINILNKNIKEEFNKSTNIILINKLKKENTINLKLLVLMLNNKDILCSLNIRNEKSIILIDNNKNMGKVVLSILEQFNYIERSKYLNLYLYSERQLNLQELAYLEDPIREYIYGDSILKINTVVNDKINEKSYFLVAKNK